MFIVALFIAIKLWNQSKCHQDKFMKEMCYILHTDYTLMEIL
jgi:hypothetical protein